MPLQAGQYHPRMGFGSWPHHITPYHTAIVSFETQLRLLVQDLAMIFESIEPTTPNMSVYGHRTRNLLILASTEFEAQCVGILKANDQASNGARYNTTDYIKLCEPLGLNEYKVALSRYPGMDTFQPFVGWNVGAPTQSIPWYDAYNKTKHDREENFNRATLQMAIQSVAACVVLLNAQICSEKNFIATFPNEYFKYVEVPTLELNYEMPSAPATWSPVLFEF